jgi:threonylcarbamoyladenosine tRNA methylthiotransferase MtaB
MLNPNNARFSYAISTMGCKANLTDSQALEARLQRMGGVATSEEEADLFLLNTCTVTDQADKEARAVLRKGKSPFTIATGCLAEVDPAQLSSVEVGEERKVRVVRNSAKDRLEDVVAEWLAGMVEEQKRVVTGDRPAWHKKILENRNPEEAVTAAARTRSFYKVQDGCNAFCSYCVIPLARGRSRSLPAAQVVKEVQAIVDSGVKEVVLTAIHAADYESDGLDFTGLVAKVLAETSVPRLRLTSLDPAEIPDRLLDLMASDSRLCPHFHVSLQAASSRVLNGMKRGYGAAEIEERFAAIHERLPHAYIGMDLIAGFPGETDEEFEEGFSRLEKLHFTKAHVFPFSVRRNTAAARLVEAGLAVPSHKIHARAAKLRGLSDQKFRASLAAKVGSMVEVLVEEKRVTVNGRLCSTGHARNFHKVLIPGQHEPNKLYRARIVGVHQDLLKGELV